jgi:RHS repeat-associated protein
MGNARSTTDKLSHTTTYTYDSWNRLVTVTDPLLHSVNWKYDAVGNLAAVTDGMGHTTTYSYDQRDRRITVTDAEGGISRMTYDNVGNLKSVTDPVLKVMTYDYNDRDERVKETDALGHARSYTYDKVGNLASMTDGMLHTKTYGYDELDRLITQTDARGGITRMTYDDVSNLKSVTDSVLNVTSYDYNQRDELISETNTLGKARTFTYDQVGNLATKTDRNNRTTKFEYDRLDRLKNEQWKDAANSTVRTFTYDYDAASRLTSAIDPDSSYTYSYDQADRLTQSNNAGTAGVPTVLLDYDYDAANYLVSTKDTIAGQVRGTTALTRDRLNRVTQIQQSGVGVANKRVDMNYDAASQLKGIKRYTDLAGTQLVAATEYNYDLAGRLQDLTHRKANNATIANYGLTYDAADRLTQVTSIDGPSIFDYDVTDQLTSADHATQTDENYGYDLNGNRTNAGNQTGGNNQLLTDGTYNYAYDDEGNRIRRTAIATGVVTEYSWDYRNRLTQVTEKNAAGVVVRSSDYKYDVYNDRIAKTVDLDGVGTQIATTERYVYDGDHIALVFDGQGNQVQRFLYGTQVDQVLVQENGNGDLLWALADYQGSVRDVVDSQGNTLNHIVYDSFGNVTSQANSAVNFRFGYTGREFDVETGLYYYRARYYDPQTGQFIGQDPLSFGAGDSNLYRYVGNSPMNFTDPSGMNWFSDRLNDAKNAASTAKYGIQGLTNFYSNPDEVKDAIQGVRIASHDAMETAKYGAQGYQETIEQVRRDPIGTIKDGSYGAYDMAGEKFNEHVRKPITEAAPGAVDVHVEQYNNPNSGPVAKLDAAIAGSFASLGREENFDAMMNTLNAGLMAGGFIQIGRALPGALKQCKDWIKAPKTLWDDAVGVITRRTSPDKTIAGSPAKVNPGYPKPGRTNNCVNCAIATDATFAGRPASALPINPKAQGLPLSAVAKGLGVNGRFVPTKGLADISTQMAKAGPGAKGVVAAHRAAGKSGHVFNVVVNKRGKVVFYDGQIKGAPIINGQGYVGYSLLRTK